MDPAALLLAPDVSAVHGGVAYGRDLERRLAPSFERAEPRQRAMASRRGRLRPAARQPSGPVADMSGDAPPDGVPHRWRRVRWDPGAGRQALRRSIIQPRGASDAVWGLEATGVLKQGPHAAGVARQDRGTAGKVDHGQRGVLRA
jgi:SRSO17 transposase